MFHPTSTPSSFRVSSHPLEIAGQTISLLPERAAFWHQAKTLFLADLHWGKTETFQSGGLAIPQGTLTEELERLNILAQSLQAKRILFLGDLVHHASGITPAMIQTVQTWRESLNEEAGVEVILILGNHDRALKAKGMPDLAQVWQLTTVAEPFLEGPFAFLHHPQETPGYYSWAGHQHPVALLKYPGKKSKADHLRLPCFHLSPTLGILPAYSHFTGSMIIKPKGNDQVFVIAEQQVIPWMNP
ncbi:MAG: ligase-associated DNA damage response endonuclease PdeM [Cyanobacteria bacterium]|nr:ligase-associated DNA damage response endonuclease PdeM [Cyanobacteriota bacterium]